MVDEVKYVPTVIRWTENGETQERRIDIEDGMAFKLEQSGRKVYTAKTYKSSKMPVWTMKKEDAYNVLGLSHAKEDKYTDKQGREIYVLNAEDVEIAKKAKPDQFVAWIGSGGRFVEASEIKSDSAKKDGGLVITHNSTNRDGKKEAFDVSVFIPKK